MRALPQTWVGSVLHIEHPPLAANCLYPGRVNTCYLHNKFNFTTITRIGQMGERMLCVLYNPRPPQNYPSPMRLTFY